MQFNKSVLCSPWVWTGYHTKSYQEYNDINGDISEEKRFIYESPDGGKTIFKREFGKPHETREKITNE